MPSSIIGFGFRDRAGIELIGTNTFEEGITLPPRLAGSTLAVDFRLRLPLIPGTYSVSSAIAADRYTRAHYDWIDNALIVTVAPPASGKAIHGQVWVPVEIGAPFVSGEASDPSRPSAEQDLLAEITDSTSLVAAQEQAVAESFDEMRRAHASLGWRAQLRFERSARGCCAIRSCASRIVSCGGHSRSGSTGLAFVFKFAARKIGAGPARAAADRRGPYLDADPRRLRDVDRTNRTRRRGLCRDARRGRGLADTPLVSVLITPGGAAEESRRRTLESLREQVDERWEVCDGVETARGGVVAFVQAGDELAPRRSSLL